MSQYTIYKSNAGIVVAIFEISTKNICIKKKKKRKKGLTVRIKWNKPDT